MKANNKASNMKRKSPMLQPRETINNSGARWSLNGGSQFSDRSTSFDPVLMWASRSGSGTRNQRRTRPRTDRRGEPWTTLLRSACCQLLIWFIAKCFAISSGAVNYTVILTRMSREVPADSTRFECSASVVREMAARSCERKMTSRFLTRQTLNIPIYVTRYKNGPTDKFVSFLNQCCSFMTVFSSMQNALIDWTKFQMKSEIH